jgi:hypothetical protein
MNNNPLQAYFRRPVIYFKLPSEGKYYPPGVVEIPANGEMAVYAMTSADEIDGRASGNAESVHGDRDVNERAATTGTSCSLTGTPTTACMDIYETASWPSVNETARRLGCFSNCHRSLGEQVRRRSRTLVPASCAHARETKFP